MCAVGREPGGSSVLGLGNRGAGRDWKDGTAAHSNGSLDSSPFLLARGLGCSEK